MQSISLSDLSKLTGLKPRTLQFWTTSGVIVPEGDTKHGGPGVHRKYPPFETIIACICAELIKYNFQISTLISASNYIRSSWKVVDDHGISSRNYVEFFHAVASKKVEISEEDFNKLLVLHEIVGASSGDDEARLYIHVENGELQIKARILGDADEEPKTTSFLTVNLSQIVPRLDSIL